MLLQTKWSYVFGDKMVIYLLLQGSDMFLGPIGHMCLGTKWSYALWDKMVTCFLGEKMVICPLGLNCNIILGGQIVICFWGENDSMFFRGRHGNMFFGTKWQCVFGYISFIQMEKQTIEYVAVLSVGKISIGYVEIQRGIHMLDT